MSDYHNGRNLYHEATARIGKSRVARYVVTSTVDASGNKVEVLSTPTAMDAVLHNVPNKEVVLQSLEINQQWVYMYASVLVNAPDYASNGSDGDIIKWRGRFYRVKKIEEDWLQQGGWYKALLYRDDRVVL